MQQDIAEKRKKALIEDLKRVAALNNNKISGTFYTKHGEMTVLTVSKYFGGLKAACEEIGVEFERKTHNVDPEVLKKKKDMCERISKGETLRSVGEAYGITRERVRQIVAKFGIKNVNRENAKLKLRELTEQELETIKNSFSTGTKKGKIAKQLNIKSFRVTEIIEKYGFKFGAYCTICGKHVEKIDKNFHTWKYCDDCSNKKHSERHNLYTQKRFKSDPAFKKYCYAKNKQWRESPKGKEGQKNIIRKDCA